MISTIQSSLLSKQIRNFPKNLIYNPPSKPDRYYMANSKGEYVGNMCAFARQRYESSFYQTDLPYKTLHISSLEILEKYWGKGYGSDFIDFAKKESYRQGCEGRVSLVAFYPGRPPHLFYFKKGFITPNQKENERFEKHIKNGEPLYYYNAVDMFLPLKEEHFPRKKNVPQLEKKPQGLKEKVLSFFKGF